jgi:hypothetical protein
MNGLKGMAVVGVTLIVLVVLGIDANAQEKKISKKEVPQAVISAFEKVYPKATMRGFAREVERGKVYYEVESVDGNTTRDLLYSADGTVYEIEEGVATGDLPEAVKSAISAKYPDGKILKAEKTTHGTAMQYEIRIQSGKSRVGMTVDPAGKVIEEKKSSSDKGKVGKKK